MRTVGRWFDLDYFVTKQAYKLIPPRLTFPADMTDDEGAIMQEHFDYWM